MCAVRRDEVLSALVLVGQVGLVMVACVVGGFALGLYLDRRLGTFPTLTVVLLLVGVGGGMVAVYRMVMRQATRGSRDGPQG